MIFFCSRDGTLIPYILPTLNQGSVASENIVLLAPFPQDIVVTVGVTLPNGVRTTRKLVSVTSSYTISDANGAVINAWRLDDRDAPNMTAFSGILTVQFFFTDASARVLASTSSRQTVNAGVFHLPENVTEADATAMAAYLAAAQHVQTAVETNGLDIINMSLGWANGMYIDVSVDTDSVTVDTANFAKAVEYAAGKYAFTYDSTLATWRMNGLSATPAYYGITFSTVSTKPFTVTLEEKAVSDTSIYFQNNAKFWAQQAANLSIPDGYITFRKLGSDVVERFDDIQEDIDTLRKDKVSHLTPHPLLGTLSVYVSKEGRDELRELRAGVDPHSVVQRTGTGAVKVGTPSEANEAVPLSLLNERIQNADANFRGTWPNYAAVPSSASQYPVDYAGSHAPTTNDYCVVLDASDYSSANTGTWKFKYTGTWNSVGRSGWKPEYKISDSPLSQAQLDALNSGITAAALEQIQTGLDGKVPILTPERGALSVYASSVVDGASVPVLCELRTTTERNSVAQRGSDGQLKACDPVESNDLVTLGYFENAVSVEAMEDTLAKRDSGGRLKAANPVESNDLVNLWYYNAHLPSGGSGGGVPLYKHTITCYLGPDGAYFNGTITILSTKSGEYYRDEEFYLALSQAVNIQGVISSEGTPTKIVVGITDACELLTYDLTSEGMPIIKDGPSSHIFEWLEYNPQNSRFSDTVHAIGG